MEAEERSDFVIGFDVVVADGALSHFAIIFGL